VFPKGIYSFVKSRFGCDTEVNIEEIIIEMDKLKDENAALRREIDDLQKEVSVLSLNPNNV